MKPDPEARDVCLAVATGLRTVAGCRGCAPSGGAEQSDAAIVHSAGVGVGIGVGIESHRSWRRLAGEPESTTCGDEG